MKIPLKSIKIKQIMYPVLLMILFLVLAIISFLAVKYFLLVMDRAISTPTEKANSLLELNLTDYNSVAAKIGLPIANLDNNQEEISAVVEVVPTAVEPILAINSSTIAKTDLKIIVYNATKTSGLAAKLQTELINAGFANISFASFGSNATSTIIRIKENVETYFTDLNNVVIKTYPSISKEILPAETKEDVWIIIGQ